MMIAPPRQRWEQETAIMATRATTNRGLHFTPGEAKPEPPLSAAKLSISGRAQEAGQIRLDVPPDALKEVIAQKQLAVTQVFKTLDVVHKDLGDFLIKVADPIAPALDGVLLNPDGTPAAGLSVEAQAPQYTQAEIKADPKLANFAWPQPHTVTDARGAFRLAVPTVPVPSNGLALTVRGASDSLTLALNRVLLVDGHAGTLPLAKALAPLPVSVVAQLKEIQSDILAASPRQVDERPQDFAAPAPQLTLGDGDCARYFRSGSGVLDRFQYSVLIRLVEPQMNQWVPLFRLRTGDRNYVPFALPQAADSFWNATGAANAITSLQGLGKLVLVNRTPIDRPIDVTDFHDKIEKSPVFLPKASTLGLGYILHLQQTWIPAGLSLGDLVYSLPLAPGEQQRIAIEERVQTATERDIETFSEDEFQTFRETQDSSALAVFNSAYDEAVRGGSSMQSSSRTGSVAATASTGIIGAIFGGGGVSAGYSSSSSSGSTSSWQNTSRDFASSASQQMHASLGRVAAASRRAARTNIRVATATERTTVTTRVVTNHNKGHALTMQWWEVLRHFSVTSEVDDVQLVCFVPLELIQFLPEGQPFSLAAMPGSRALLLARWSMAIRYHDVIFPLVRRNAEYAYGMQQLRNFAANPEVLPASSTLQTETINFTLTGTFVPFEEIFVTVVGRTGARVGPIKLTAPGPITTVDLTPEKYASRQELLGHLKDRRLNASDATLRASIPLPDWFARSDVARLDVSRRFTSLAYKLKLPAVNFAATLLGDLLALQTALQNQTIALAPAELERELGGPVLRTADAILPGNVNLLSAASYSAGDQMPGTLAMPAVRVAPVLSFADLLRIEAVFHHVIRNTVFYSKAVWAALSDEERAILLERYTIGVPAGGVTGPDQEVPLLNCVANRVLGFFGNAAIMPFAIPPQVAAAMKITSRDIQDALLRFHRQAFQPPRSSITLPARGTLGEAVLGACASAEKIDLTRFWNWQDSPSDQADAIPPSVFTPAQPLTTAGTAAGAGGSGVGGGAGSAGSIISINSPAATTPSTALIEALIAKSPDLAKELNLTGLETLQKQITADTQSAAAGRKEAIDSVTNIQLQAMKSAEGMVKSVADAAAKIVPALAGAPAGGGSAGGGSGGGGSGGGSGSGGGGDG
jgi:hypothetical protein